MGETLGDLMAARGWPGAAAWARRADRIAPTIVGGSKKHGGADLGPTRAKRAWAELGVDGIGVADKAPGADADPLLTPRLTCEMVARLQGWQVDWGWQFSGRKTARYRQIGNALPALGRGGGRDRHRPRARARGRAGTRRGGGPDARARSGVPRAPLPGRLPDRPADRRPGRALVRSRPVPGAVAGMSPAAVLGRLRHLGQDFELEVADSRTGALPAGHLSRPTAASWITPATGASPPGAGIKLDLSVHGGQARGELLSGRGAELARGASRPEAAGQLA